jgi:hypothetical protein
MRSAGLLVISGQQPVQLGHRDERSAADMDELNESSGAPRVERAGGNVKQGGALTDANGQPVGKGEGRDVTVRHRWASE